MTAVRERLRSRNRTLLEMMTGIAGLGILIQSVLLFFPDRLWHSVSLWIGLATAVLAVLHSYRSLDRALDYDERTAQRRIYSGYLVRYFSVAAILVLTCLIPQLHPLLTFAGVITWKGTAYLQPFIHKFCNHYFHETDPTPVTEEEYQASLAREREEGASMEAGSSPCTGTGEGACVNDPAH